jgi:deoxycytidine triphosphate deaminase
MSMDAPRGIKYIPDMQILSGKAAASRVAGILHPKYQVHGYSIDLTARKIFSMDPTGQIDFGGSEYVAAGRIEIASQRTRQEDSYQWWDLASGSYFVECNESLDLTENEIALIEPDDRLLRAGAWHVPMYLRGRIEPVQLLLKVGAARLRVKENARLARFRLFRFAEDANTDRSSSKLKPRLRKISGRKKIARS